MHGEEGVWVVEEERREWGEAHDVQEVWAAKAEQRREE